jgi:hypothetical protein
MNQDNWLTHRTPVFRKANETTLLYFLNCHVITRSERALSLFAEFSGGKILGSVIEYRG